MAAAVMAPMVMGMPVMVVVMTMVRVFAVTIRAVLAADAAMATARRAFFHGEFPADARFEFAQCIVLSGAAGIGRTPNIIMQSSKVNQCHQIIIITA